MTREDIEQLNVVEPYCFESDREEQWYNVGLKHGLEIADNNPKSPWISVEDDLPCNHEHLMRYDNLTKRVLAINEVGFLKITRMIKEKNREWMWGYDEFKIDYWMPIPKLEGVEIYE